MVDALIIDACRTPTLHCSISRTTMECDDRRRKRLLM